MIYQKVIEELLKTSDGQDGLSMLVIAAVNEFNTAKTVKDKTENYKTLVYLGKEIDAVFDQKYQELKVCYDAKQYIKNAVNREGDVLCQTPTPA